MPPSRPRPPRAYLAAQIAVPLLLVVVALVHIALVHAGPLNPWVGGGFGMFAQVDRREHRVVRADAELGGRRVALDIAAFTDASGENLRLVRRTTALPTEGALRGMGAALAEQEWTAEGEPWSGGEAAEEPVAKLSGLRVEVRRLGYEGGPPRARPDVLAALRVSS